MVTASLLVILIMRRRWASAYVMLQHEDDSECAQLSRAAGQCMTCHSGGHFGPILCENGECPALYARLGAARRLAAAGTKLERMNISEPW